MEERRFDHLTRILSTAASRRGVLYRLATLSLAGVLTALPAEEGFGARRRRRRKARHDPGQDKDNRKGKRHRKRRHGRCTPDCTGKVCGPDGCGEECAPGCTDPVHTCDAQGQCVPPGCADGVQNGDETGVDCGGSCPPCGLG
jgi:hypothetical protein